MGYRSREDWRWDPRRHRTPVNRSIDVSSSTQEDVEARERKIRAGAHVVPFGFSVREDPPPPSEPVLWEGDYS